MEHRPKACRTQPAIDTINTASRKYSMRGLAGHTDGCGLNMLWCEVSPSQGMVHSGHVWSPLPYSAFSSFCPVSTVIEEGGAPTRGVLPFLDFQLSSWWTQVNLCSLQISQPQSSIIRKPRQGDWLRKRYKEDITVEVHPCVNPLILFDLLVLQ